MPKIQLAEPQRIDVFDGTLSGSLQRLIGKLGKILTMLAGNICPLTVERPEEEVHAVRHGERHFDETESSPASQWFPAEEQTASERFPWERWLPSVSTGGG